MHEAIAIAHTIINWFISHKTPILALFGGGAGIWATAEVLFRKFHVSVKTVSWFVSHLIALGASLAAYAIANTNVEISYPWLFAIAESIHRFVESKTYTEKIVPFLQGFNSKQTSTVTTTSQSLPIEDNPFAAPQE